MDNGGDYQTCYCKGFTLVEILAVIVIVSVLMLIAVLSVMGVTERIVKEVCDANRLELERNYRVHFIVESKVHTSTAFKEFLLAFGNKICPVDGEISYVNGKVECIVILLVKRIVTMVMTERFRIYEN